ncbi:MAG TPA: NADH-quinone oxidoreductase subunit J [Rickettsiales bacterium]|nr:NADH-quinone oxidoreductase subunit J [Rickettsiales bacterium]
MIIATLVFYLFAIVLVFSALMVIGARNPVHSVLFLILAFFNAAGLFLLIGAEYLAMTLVIVYVGAVAVLFLFVIMMLDVDFASLKQGFLRYLPVGGTVAAVLFGELIFAVMSSLHNTHDVAAKATPIVKDVPNTQAIGNVLYTDYIYAFQVAGLILLVAMIGAIVLTHRTRPGVRRQKIAAQIDRKRSDAVELVKVKPGQGA